jgi:hypothetical protein
MRKPLGDCITFWKERSTTLERIGENYEVHRNVSKRWALEKGPSGDSVADGVVDAAQGMGREGAWLAPGSTIGVEGGRGQGTGGKIEQRGSEGL